MADKHPRRSRAAGALAAAAGTAVRYLPGTAGAVCASASAWMVWAPLGWLAAGTFLLLLDRRMR
ncbi:hypothetical protein [Kitasatospora cineracea]|uniref:hypothetical protein n=1 Tax=Kitasatospora cineracea TaxID=88074 RepID=UPI00367FB076